MLANVIEFLFEKNKNEPWFLNLDQEQAQMEEDYISHLKATNKRAYYRFLATFATKLTGHFLPSLEPP
jgi:hypothetical protein